MKILQNIFFVLLLGSTGVSFALNPCPVAQYGYWNNCFGTHNYDDGSKYIGEWRDNKRNGRGTYTFPNGEVQEGIWKNGEFQYVLKKGWARYNIKLKNGEDFPFTAPEGITDAQAVEMVNKHLLQKERTRVANEEAKINAVKRKERERVNDKKRKFVKDIIKRFQDGCRGKSGSDWNDCWPKYLPSKCRGLVYLDGNVPWQQCVMSCANESVYSRTFGECSH